MGFGFGECGVWDGKEGEKLELIGKDRIQGRMRISDLTERILRGHVKSR